MKLYLFNKFKFFKNKTYFCEEPWIGIFSVSTNMDVIFCPCYLQIKIGNLNKSSMQEIWNSKKLIRIRKSFKKGNLPKICRKQICPVAIDNEKNNSLI